MSQVGKQRASSIESEQTKSSGGAVGGKKSKKSAPKSAPKSRDCEVLDSHSLIDADDFAAPVSKEQQVQRQSSESAKRGSQSQLQSHKLHGAGANQQFDKTNYHSAELNNNSIPPPGAESQKSLETPLSLLTGLRMHTSNLRAAQKSGEQATAQVTTRKPLIGKSGEQSAAPEPQQRGSPSNVTSSTTLSYVESSLNPPDTPVSKTITSHSPYIPSYTSLFNYQKPTGGTPSPSPDQQPKLSAPTSGSSYSQQLFSESVKKTTTTNSRSPLIKQPVLHQPSDLSARSLLSSANRQLEATKRLPSIFDQSRGRLREPVDYDDESTANRRQRLQRLEAANREDVGENIIDYQDEHQVEDDDEEPELDFQERGLDDHSVSSDYSNTQRSRNLFGNLKEQTGADQPGKRLVVNSSPESQKTGTTHLIHQSSKYPGSSGKLKSATRARGRSPARREQSSTRISMGSQQQLGSGKKLAQAPQTQSQTRISFNEMSRPPSFNTTTQQLDGHDMKSSSCRKLDLLEQAAHLDCACQACSKNRKLAESLYHYHGHHQLGSASKLPNLKLNKTSDKNYPKTRVMHMVLKSVILVLCTLLLLLLLVGTIMLSIHLPQSMDKVVGATRQFNVTIAGRR